MKTYTEEELVHDLSDEEWVETTGGSFLRFMNVPQGFILCNCVRLMPGSSVGSFKTCKNCLGYGIPPIPFEETQ